MPGTRTKSAIRQILSFSLRLGGAAAGDSDSGTWIVIYFRGIESDPSHAGTGSSPLLVTALRRKEAAWRLARFRPRPAGQRGVHPSPTEGPRTRGDAPAAVGFHAKRRGASSSGCGPTRLTPSLGLKAKSRRWEGTETRIRSCPFDCRLSVRFAPLQQVIRGRRSGDKR